MSSSSSSDCENCNYYQCYSLDNNYDAYNYGRPVRSSRHVPFYSTVGHPLIYYAEVVSRLIHTPPSMYQHFPYSLLLGNRITTNFCQTLFQSSLMFRTTHLFFSLLILTIKAHHTFGKTYLQAAHEKIDRASKIIQYNDL